jgi:hypothetical protein
VPELDHILESRVEAVEQVLEQFFGVGYFGWQLKQHGAQLFAQPLGHRAIEIGQNWLSIRIEFLVVRDLARRFHGKAKVSWALGVPTFKSLEFRHPVEGHIQFQGIELSAVILKPLEYSNHLRGGKPSG